MAKRKYEFRPDPTDSGIANKLVLTPQQRRQALKWMLYSLLWLTALVLQDALLSRIRILGGMVDLVPAVIVLVCIMEGAHDGCVFTLIASMFYVFSGTGQGTFCIAFLTVYSILAAVFRQSYLRRGFSSAWLCGAVVMAAYEMSVFGVGLFFGLTYGGRAAVFGMTALASALAMPALYPLVSRICEIGGETWKE